MWEDNSWPNWPAKAAHQNWLLLLQAKLAGRPCWPQLLPPKLLAAIASAART